MGETIKKGGAEWDRAVPKITGEGESGGAQHYQGRAREERGANLGKYL